ncbi:hypothetical protein EYF80_026372 [Liparis tanakae]|uniref:Uncharacterized protein n=1 Tax=Liparis tanakae TaxID=230148 RepID=A0A4Z2HCE3_9TELE|nr:hypothetical protein EYF80_026372 [Liparis tanakae]
MIVTSFHSIIVEVVAAQNQLARGSEELVALSQHADVSSDQQYFQLFMISHLMSVNPAPTVHSAGQRRHVLNS